MSVTVKDFGENVKRYILATDTLSLSVLDFGATINKIEYAGRDLCLGFDNMEGYRLCANDNYQGATVGRYANRIAGGKFVLNGVEYDVGCNEKGRGHLHGGKIGLNQKIWKAETVSENPPSVKFSQKLADNEEGYPGNMDISVTFTVVGSSFSIKYEAVSDKDTVFNPTNHTYFNINGYDGEDILSTTLKIDADRITPVDNMLIPTGEYLYVKGTPFDFGAPKKIGEEINSDHPQMKIGGGYDHNFVLGETREMRHAVTAHSDISGITLDCSTDMPGIQLYTSNFLSQKNGKGGIDLHKHQGFCLETQFFPDSPNHPEFPSATLKKGEKFTSVTEYTLSRG